MCRRNLSGFSNAHNAYGKFLRTFIRGLPRYSQLLATVCDLIQNFIFPNLSPKNVEFKLMIECHQTVCLGSIFKC